MKEKTIYLTVKIDYEFNERKTDDNMSLYDAQYLAIKPNYNTIQNGVKIKSVEVRDVDLNKE